MYFYLIGFIKDDNTYFLISAVTLIKHLISDSFNSVNKMSIIKLSIFDCFSTDKAEFITKNKNIVNIIRNMYYNQRFIYYCNDNDTYRFHNILKEALYDELLSSDININSLY